MIGRLQDMIKESSSILAPHVKTETKETKHIINQIDNEFKDKSEKIKVINIIIFRKLHKHSMKNLGWN